MRLPIVPSSPHLSCRDLTILKILLVIPDYVIQTLVHFQTSNIISCNTSPQFNAVRSICAVGNSIILEQISWVTGWLHHVILTLLSLNHNFMKFLCSNNKSQMSHISVMTSLLRLTNCFFLSVDSLFISSLSAFISSSLYWKSRTINLHLEVNKIKCLSRDPSELETECTQNKPYLYSLALCLKSSTAFLNKVTLQRQLSWSSKSTLDRKKTNQISELTRFKSAQISHTVPRCTLLLQGKT